jgi:hypothetical protein
MKKGPVLELESDGSDAAPAAGPRYAMRAMATVPRLRPAHDACASDDNDAAPAARKN